jgi:hypothetical protein
MKRPGTENNRIVLTDQTEQMEAWYAPPHALSRTFEGALAFLLAFFPMVGRFEITATHKHLIPIGYAHGKAA